MRLSDAEETYVDGQDYDPETSGDDFISVTNVGNVGNVSSSNVTDQAGDMGRDPKFPNIKVRLDLTGPSGNAFAIISKVQRALAVHGANAADLEQFFKEASGGDYENLLTTVGRWVRMS